MCRNIPAVLAIILVIFQGSNATVFGEEPLQFNRDIRPILSAACFRCHGFDSKARQADLRLDDADSAFQKRKTGVAISAGDLASSMVWQRIQSSDVEQVMPPPESHRQLSDHEKSLIKRWIEQGASFQQHWSLEPIRPVEPPAIANAPEAWQKSMLDRFLWDGMQRQGLSAQTRADRSTLIRRVAFALTGLPPTVEEVAQFELDRSEEAYSSMVDRYLESPRFGEEMARHWLDVARYGDTHGLHLDNERQMWAYRDWVVDAFNRNLPFSDFTIEQLAGDLLPMPTQSQLVATGFNRCNVTTSEGGAIADEFLYRYAVDRTSTTIQTWMGMTGGCAVCHDHKYDPISTREFYSMYAFFYSAADPAMDGNIDRTEPFLSLASPEQEAHLQRLRKWVDNTKLELKDAAKQPCDLPIEPSPSLVAEMWLDDQFPIGSTTRNTTRNAATWSSENELDIPVGRRALRQAFGNKFEQTIADGLVPRIIPKDAMFRIWLRRDADQPSDAVFVEFKTSQGTKRWIWADSNEKAELLGKADRRMGPLPQKGTWSQLVVSADQLGLAASAEVSEIKLGQFGGVCWWDGLTVHGTAWAQDDPRRDVSAWWASRKGKSTPLANASLDKVLKAGPDAEDAKQSESEVAEFFHAYITTKPSPRVSAARTALGLAEVDVAMANDQVPGTFIFRDQAKPREAFVMLRGAYDKKGDPVQPDTPSFLPKLKKVADQNPNRLDLARWLVADDHPLTARVTVNRFWQQIFGLGLVKTSDDFGSQGTPPSHPELLDTLAHQFRTTGWNVKQLIRQMVCSEAFCQSSAVGSAAYEKDPENRWLARGPRIRLDAEQIRDNALSVSGLLSLRVGGPGAKIYQPPNIWEPVGYGDSNTRYYLQDHSQQLYRRSLYCFIKRTAPPPFMSNFDAPNREFFCTRRERSNTPLQALQLMNDVQHVEAAKHLAQRMIKEGGIDTLSRIRFAYRTVVARWPRPEEVQVVEHAFQNFVKRFEKEPEDASQLISVGRTPASDTIPATELAAYTLLANLILNLDEVITRN